MLNETNGILADDDYGDYVMKRIYFESDLDNQFFRKDSDFESYESPYGYRGRIEVKNIPVFSFRYKNTFSKSEEEEF
jgi:hypothetical protein